MRNKLRKLMMLTTAACLVSTSVMGVSAATLEDCFDADYYVSSYADLEEALGSDRAALFKHFKEYGIEEGRQANRYFDVKVYRERYADLDAAFGDDWDAYYDHYLTYGLFEGRSALASGEVFDAKTYAELYPDLKEAFGDDVLAYYMHYITFGIKEGRVFTLPPVVEDSGNSGNDEVVAVEEDNSAVVTEWVDAIGDSLVADDVDLTLSLLSEFPSLQDKCSSYENVGWAENTYSVTVIGTTTYVTFDEVAYKFTTSDGTVVGVVVYTKDSGDITNLFAFVADADNNNGFDYIAAGDHFVARHYSTYMYSFVKDDMYTTVTSDGEVYEEDLSDGHIVYGWHDFII